MLDCKACGKISEVDPRLKLSSFILKNEPKKGKKDKAERKAARKAKQNGQANGNGSGSGAEDNSDNSADKENVEDIGDANGDIASDDDAFTRKIKTEAQVLKNETIEVKDDDWAVDMSEEAVKARQQNLPGEFKQKLVLNGEDEDEDGDDEYNECESPFPLVLSVPDCCLVDCGVDVAWCTDDEFNEDESQLQQLQDKALYTDVSGFIACNTSATHHSTGIR